MAVPLCEGSLLSLINGVIDKRKVQPVVSAVKHSPSLSCQMLGSMMISPTASSIFSPRGRSLCNFEK